MLRSFNGRDALGTRGWRDVLADCGSAPVPSADCFEESLRALGLADVITPFCDKRELSRIRSHPNGMKHRAGWPVVPGGFSGAGRSLFGQVQKVVQHVEVVFKELGLQPCDLGDGNPFGMQRIVVGLH